MTEVQGIGVDVGKQELVLCVRSSNGLTETPAAFPNDVDGFKRIISYLSDRGVGRDQPILLESTGPYHWKPASYLSEQKLVVKILNPLHTRYALRYSIRKCKTDQVDAGHLAFLASQGYGYLFQETSSMAHTKALVRHYWTLHAMAGRAILHEKYLREYREIDEFGVSGHIRSVYQQVESKILKLFEGKSEFEYLDSIPGVSPLLAATILTELDPLSRFTRIEQVIAYAGLDPQVKQSGGRKPAYGKLSKRGSRILRQALFFAAFGSFNSSTFRPIYDQYKAKGHHHTTILCILARKILRIAFTLLKHNQPFDKNYLTLHN